jgi:hypothetical protein
MKIGLPVGGQTDRTRRSSRHEIVTVASPFTVTRQAPHRKYIEAMRLTNSRGRLNACQRPHLPPHSRTSLGESGGQSSMRTERPSLRA